MKQLLRRGVVSILVAVVCVHYLEVYLLPAAQKVRALLYGAPLYSTALDGCAATLNNDDWIHPATLSLTVYGLAQRHLGSRYEPHEPEILPDYAAAEPADEELRCVADYLLSVAPRSSGDDGALRTLHYDTPKAIYGIEPGWVSGLAQSFAGQVMLAAHVRFGEQAYFDAALELGNLLQVPIADGGVLIRLGPEQVWYEEYAQAGAAPPMVLNGHLIALDLLYWLQQADPGGPWAEMFAQGVRATALRIGDYTGLSWSHYDSFGNLANHKYQHFHVRQLRRYSQHDGSGSLSEAQQRMTWQLRLPLGIIERVLTQPSRLLAFLIGTLSVAIFCFLTLVAMLLNRRQRR